jgi:hypothetical protein
MSLETNRVEIESYCGHCGERLPDLGDNRVGACPSCRKRFELSGDTGVPFREKTCERTCRRSSARAYARAQKRAHERAREAAREAARERGRCACGLEFDPFRYDPPIRDPLLAGLLSAICPGLGQAYNGHFVKAVVVFLTCFLILPYFLGILDAFVSAKENNRIQPAVVRRGCHMGCR